MEEWTIPFHGTLKGHSSGGDEGSAVFLETYCSS